ncbi:class F sortase [Streptomyces sp. NPDC052051]|uniref:class F sortase n=1 Tax=Streptomyces sp. NPDC052051 TaxID=3154649 RepID=UPI0034429230
MSVKEAQVQQAGSAREVANAAIASASAIALCGGLWLLHHAAEGHSPPQPSVAQAATGADRIRSAAPALAPSVPVRVRIPEIRVDAPLTGLGLTRTGRLEAPPAGRRNLAGWYAAGTVPGGVGTAIVAGHVDTARGPAVFYALGALPKGSTIEVGRRDGSTAVFTVYAVEVYAANAFPDDRVYGAAGRPELRVITCGGGYTKATGYQGNVVVFARLTGSRVSGSS